MANPKISNPKTVPMSPAAGRGQTAPVNQYRERERQVFNPLVPVAEKTSSRAGIRAASVDQSDGGDFPDPYDTAGPAAFGDVGVGPDATPPSGQDAGEDFGATFIQTADNAATIDG
jgi:hypothetical protein